MATTAEIQGFGARAPYAQPRASEYDMKERVRLSGLFPRVRNEPMSNQLQALMKDFEKNAALTGILERRRRLEERLQFELKGSEGMDALNRNLAPPFRAGLAGAASSASVADRLARSRVAGQLAAAVAANAPAAQDAADVMTGGAPAKAAAKVRIRAPPKAGAKATAPVVSVVGVSQEGGSSGSTDPVLAVAKVPPAKAAAAKAPAKAPAKARDTRRSPSTSRQRV